MLASAVEPVGDRTLVVGPVRCEDLIGPAAEQQLIGVGLGDLPHHLVVEVVGAPAAERESASRVLLWAPGRLHDPIERDERVHSELSHRTSSVSWVSFYMTSGNADNHRSCAAMLAPP